MSSIEVTIRPLEIPAELPEVVAVWNRAMPDPFKITEEVLRGHLDYDPNYEPKACIGAYTEDGQLAGVLIGKRWLIPNHDMAQDDAMQWVRDGSVGVGIIFVDPPFQRQGIGSQLMHAFEEFAKDRGGAIVTIGREPGRHMLPGIPEPCDASHEFFEKLGYGGLGIEMAIDIMGDISDKEDPPVNNPKLAEKIAQNRADGYEVVGYSPEYRDAFLSFMREAFPGKWFWTSTSLMDTTMGDPSELQLLIHVGDDGTTVWGMACTASQANACTGAPTIFQSNGDPEFGGLGPVGIHRDLRGHEGSVLCSSTWL